MMNRKERKVFEKILHRKCPTCESYDTVEEKDSPAIIYMASYLPQFLKERKRVDILRCNKCHSIHQSDGNSLAIK